MNRLDMAEEIAKRVPTLAVRYKDEWINAKKLRRAFQFLCGYCLLRDGGCVPARDDPLAHLHCNTPALAGTCPQADTSEREGEIDQLVYQLYGLSEDEVKIFEGK